MVVLDPYSILTELETRDDDNYEATRITGGASPGSAKQSGEWIAGNGIDVVDVR